MYLDLRTHAHTNLTYVLCCVYVYCITYDQMHTVLGIVLPTIRCILY